MRSLVLTVLMVLALVNNAQASKLQDSYCVAKSAAAQVQQDIAHENSKPVVSLRRLYALQNMAEIIDSAIRLRVQQAHESKVTLTACSAVQVLTDYPPCSKGLFLSTDKCGTQSCSKTFQCSIYR